VQRTNTTVLKNKLSKEMTRTLRNTPRKLILETVTSASTEIHIKPRKCDRKMEVTVLND
jgi:hypothetical protein